MSSKVLTFIATGAILMLIALLIEIEHKIIWKNYKNNYHKHQNEFIDKLLKPNETVYNLNIYVVWPLVLILGTAIIIVNLQ